MTQYMPGQTKEYNHLSFSLQKINAQETCIVYGIHSQHNTPPNDFYIP